MDPSPPEHAFTALKAKHPENEQEAETAAVKTWQSGTGRLCSW